MKSGIYKIHNIINDKLYIGSSRDLSKRLSQHKYHLKRNTHHCKPLQNAWNMYKGGAFIFEIIEYVLPENLVRVEQSYLDSNFPKYNVLKTVEVPGSFERSEEYRSNASKRMYARYPKGAPPALLAKSKTLNIGRKHNQEFKDKVTENLNVRYSDPVILKKQIKQLDNIRKRTKIKVTDVKSKAEYIFPSMTEASRFFDLQQSCVWHFCQDNKTHKNKLWEKV